MDDVGQPSRTVKVIGHQWYWSYEIRAAQEDGLVLGDEAVAKSDSTSSDDYIDKIADWAVQAEDSYRSSRTHDAVWEAAFREFLEEPEFVADTVENHLELINIWLDGNPGEPLPHVLEAVLAELQPEGEIDLLSNGLTVHAHSTAEAVSDVNCAACQAAEEVSDAAVHAGEPGLIKKSFDAYMVLEEDLQVGEHRLLEVDNRLYLPS